jgi:hypothetical protein
MAAPAERMIAMRDRRRRQCLRELRVLVPDAGSRAVRLRVAKQVAGLKRGSELDALKWIEAVSELKDDETRWRDDGGGERRLRKAAAGRDREDGCLSGRP